VKDLSRGRREVVECCICSSSFLNVQKDIGFPDIPFSFIIEKERHESSPGLLHP